MGWQSSLVDAYPRGLRLIQARSLLRFARRPPSSASLSAFQDFMLPRLVRHAAATSPYVRDLLSREGLAPEDISSASDVRRLPLTSKTSMRGVPAEDLISMPFRRARLRPFLTTGSTGTPFLIRRTAFEEVIFHVFNYRCMREYGLKPRDRVLRVRSAGRWDKPFSWRAAEASGLFRQDRLPTSLSPSDLAEALSRRRPAVLTGYTAVLARAAEALLARGSGPLGCRLVVVGAEFITPRIRESMRRAFGGNVYDTYSSQEVGMMAWECPRTGLYHVCDDNVILEVLKPGGGAPCHEGEEGEVVVTCLHTLAMPFLRFRLEDVAVRGPSPCPCGAPYSTIAGIRGRLQDYFLLPDGREIYAWYLVSLFPEHAPWVRQYDWEQDGSGRILMRILPLRPPTPEDLIALQDLIRSVLSPCPDLRVEVVKDIPPGPGGKSYYQRSRRFSAYRPEDLA